MRGNYSKGGSSDEYDDFSGDIYLPKGGKDSGSYGGTGKGGTAAREDDGFWDNPYPAGNSDDVNSNSEDDMVPLNGEFFSERRERGGSSGGKKPKKKKPWYVRFAHAVFPRRGDPAREIVRKSILLAAAVALIVSGSILCTYLVQKIRFTNGLNEARELYNPELEGISGSGIQNKFDALYAKNPDFRGWLTVPGTETDNPVYQADDNDYYLKRDLNKKRSAYGSLFLDYRDKVNISSDSQNQIIYGHHMKDGSMLAQITKYREVKFYKQNPVISFDTVYRDGKYKVFAAFITNAEPKDDNGYCFNYCVPEFNDQSEFMAWIEQVRRRSLIVTGVDVMENDEILTLSTCTYDLSRKVNLRFVVMGRRIRAGESEEVDLTAVKRNSNPLYPAAWYARKGGMRPQFADGIYEWHPGDGYVPGGSGITTGSSNESGSSEGETATPSKTTSSSSQSPSENPSANGTTSPEGPGDTNSQDNSGNNQNNTDDSPGTGDDNVTTSNAESPTGTPGEPSDAPNSDGGHPEAESGPEGGNGGTSAEPSSPAE